MLEETGGAPDATKVEQGSTEWLQARVGSIGASRLHEVLAKTKTGWGASRANVMATLVVERLTGAPVETFSNAAMQWGNEQEQSAREAYEFYANVSVETVGLIRHPNIRNSHASPDGLIGIDGLVEIKCPTSATHIETLLNQRVAEKYMIQMQWQMAVTGRQWCDFVSYDPRMPEEMRLWKTRVTRDQGRIEDLEREVRIFLEEVDAKVDQLVSTYR